MSEPVLIKAHALSAIRGERVLYTGLDLTLRGGEVVLLRGRNGTGKTTLLRQLAGLSDAPTGSVVWSANHHWLGHANGLKAHETPRTHLRHWARVWGSDADVDVILTEMGLARPADVPCRMLSAGQKRRTALARLNLQARKIWLLDEPFNALDTEGQALLAEMIETHRARGGGVISALHGASPIQASAEVVL